MTKITTTLVSRVNRKMSMTFTVEQEVKDETESEAAGTITAKLFLAHCEGFANVKPRRY